MTDSVIVLTSENLADKPTGQFFFCFLILNSAIQL